MSKVQRIYTPVTADSCIATPHVKINGQLSYAPLAKGSIEHELISDVVASGGIVDMDYSLLSSKKGHAEQGQIELTLLLPDEEGLDTKGVVKIGINEDSIPIFSTDSNVDGLKVNGTFGGNTLYVMGQLATLGTALRITGIHIDAADDKHYTGKMVERQFSHDGTSAGDKNHLYPRSMASDEQTTIRSLQGLDITLDGFGYLEMPIYKGIEVNLTLTTTYIK